MALSSHLYVLAAMNQADVSIEPLDVAFIRRWEPFHLSPNSQLARWHAKAAGPTATLPTAPTTIGEVVEAAIRAWEHVNKQIAVGRGAEYELGHGVFFREVTPPFDLNDSLRRAVSWWAAIAAHTEEVFFGDPFGIAAAFRADTSGAFYRLDTVPFGQDQRQVLIKPAVLDQTNIYSLLRHVGG